MLDTFHKCLVLLGSGQRTRWAVVIVLALFTSGLEVVGALIVFGLLTRITSGDSVLDVPLLGDLRMHMPGVDENVLVAGVALAIGLLFVLRAAAILAQGYAENRLAENAGVRLASRLLEGYLEMPYSFHLQRNSAELIRNTYDTTQLFVRDALLPGVRLIGHALLSAGLIAVLLYSSPWPTVLALAVLGPVTWVLLRVIHPRVKQLGQIAQSRARTSLQTLEESLGGWRDIKVLGRERFFVEQFEADRRAFARARYLRAAAKELPRVAVETVLVLIILSYLAASEIAGDGALEALPALGLAGYVAIRLQPSINAIMVALNSLKFVGPGIDLLYEDVRLFPTRPAAVVEVTPLPLRRELRLESVSVRYPGAHREALSDASLTIHAGEFIGIVGPTGGGKTTLIDVILGLLEPTSGAVTVDGVDLRGRTAAWQASLGVVHQMLFLADTTLRRNIALGLREEQIDESLVEEAVDLAQLRGFVSSLPDGLDTIVGERGTRVSGGQRQRLAIARALYRRPTVIVFDEGTSALDDSTEADLMAALEPLRGERTIIVVAHRSTTVATCDRAVLVDDGCLVDIAPFEQLTARHRDRLLARP
jgi:ABC-type multidrug transport system fused ATPase/permease subunit